MKEADSIIEPASLFARSKDSKIKITDLQSFSFFKAPITNKWPDKDVTLSEIANLLKSDKYQAKTEKGRSIKIKADFDIYKQSAFDSTTFSGTFIKRKNDFLKVHSGLICPDIDGLTARAVQTMKDRVLSVYNPALMFVSPSGKGLKIVYQIDLTKGTHKQYFAALQNFYKETFQTEIDKKCGDVSRACFLCYDPECFYSETPDILSAAFLEAYSVEQTAQQTAHPETVLSEDDQTIIIERLKVWANNKGGFQEGNRNGYITDLATACNRSGLDESFVLDNLLEYAEPGFSEEGIRATVKSVFSNKKHHGTNLFNNAADDFKGTFIDSTDETPPLPVEGFPVFIQRLIKEYTEVYGTHPDLITSAILCATSAAMGQSVVVKNKYENPMLFWLAVIGWSGSGKTGAFNLAFEPLHRKDLKVFQGYKNKMDLYFLEVANQKKGSVKMAKPEPCSQNIIIDSTPEAIAQSMSANQRGITLLRDELNGFIQDIGRYAKSGEVENYLSTWSQTPLKVNRSSGNNLFIKEPFLNIFGGIQPGVLPEMAKDGRMANGFLQRFCFVWPDNMQAPAYSFTELSEDLKTEYSKYIEKLLSLQTYRETIYLDFDAQEEYANFCNKNVDLNNSGIPDYLKEVNAKLNIIVKRLALLLHYSNWVYAKVPEKYISEATMISAIQMAEYFRLTQNKVYKVISQTGTELNKKTTAKYLISIGNSQTAVAKALKVSQPYINKILKQ